MKIKKAPKRRPKLDMPMVMMSTADMILSALEKDAPQEAYQRAAAAFDRLAVMVQARWPKIAERYNSKIVVPETKIVVPN